MNKLIYNIGITIIISIFLSGCISELTVYTPTKFTKSDKTIAIKAGSRLNRQLKIAFRKAGWKVKNDATYIESQGYNNNKVHITTTLESITRYRIESRSRDGLCACDCGGYSISLIDNKIGEEIVSLDEGMALASCYSTAANKLVNWIKQNTTNE
jgi:hypothetical protein